MWKCWANLFRLRLGEKIKLARAESITLGYTVYTEVSVFVGSLAFTFCCLDNGYENVSLFVCLAVCVYLLMHMWECVRDLVRLKFLCHG